MSDSKFSKIPQTDEKTLTSEEERLKASILEKLQHFTFGREKQLREDILEIVRTIVK